ncbi:VanZ family protein [Chitinibacter fontanus]|uniref:VanZ family protein n=1 Tax=Chitinibacter fontanus TaxID=1737446 RepID=A0A7D5ZBF7_9NEIS|nr:VanZ family protein [Chitinibacter fontanus]QLI83062.1 VanZ family protein [Chitinibacter fontanus]
MKWFNQQQVKLACLVVWALAIWIGSLMPSPPPAVVENGDKVQHFFGYAVLACLAFRVAQRYALVWFFAALMGVGVEIAQSFTPWRTFDIGDMLANALGAVIGLLICRFLVWRKIQFL